MALLNPIKITKVDKPYIGITPVAPKGDPVMNLVKSGVYKPTIKKFDTNSVPSVVTNPTTYKAPEPEKNLQRGEVIQAMMQKYPKRKDAIESGMVTEDDVYAATLKTQPSIKKLHDEGKISSIDRVKADLESKPMPITKPNTLETV